jgi:S-DNA-T family DNA segregation ATPase FtsK/SpoIIIE
VTDLAKRKRKRKSIGTSLKYEVYGIMLITVSIIALSGEAAVGRSLSKLFGLALGKFYFVLALVGIFIGLYVMVKRAWPKGWTSKRTGLLIVVLAFTLMSSISEIDRKLSPVAELSGGLIWSQLSTDLRTQLIYVATSNDLPIRDKPISGGYVGALQYSVLFSLFGYYGAKLIMFVMFAISLMLMTGKSYVELIRFVVRKAVRVIKLMKDKLAQRAARRQAAVSSAGNSAISDVDDEDEVIDDDYEDYVSAPPKRSWSLFFSRLRGKQAEADQDEDDDDEWVLEQREAPTMPGVVRPKAEQEARWEKSGAELPEAHSDPDDLLIPPAAEGPGPIKADMTQKPVPVVPDPSYADAEDLFDDYVPVDDEADQSFVADAPDHAEDVHEESGSAAGEVSEALISEAEAVKQAAAETDEAVEPKEQPYLLPPFSLLNKPSLMGKTAADNDMYDSRRKLEATLESFGVRAKVLDVVRGPAVTRYEVQPATGVKVSRIVGLTDDIALALAAKDVRMEAPIPGKSAIGIEVPNMEVSVVTMREVMETSTFQNATSKLSIAFGRDISGQTIVGNLAKMPHLLVAGATGSGKSVCINGIITSILYKAAPDEVKFLMIDPKMVELNVYNGIPHLLAPVVTNPKRASLALKKIVVEMESRYELFSKSSTRNIEGYNTLMADNPAAVLPYIVVIVDELADLMMVAAGDVEDSIARLAQMARAAGIHLIIATQRPSVDVITGVIKANIPSRIAFGVSSQVDSRTILDMAGAEKLLGRGDMLFLPVGMSKPIRVQGAFLSDQEVETLVHYTRDQAEAVYQEDLVPEVAEEGADSDEQLDELFDQAVQIIVEAKQASVSLLQRRMRIGYTRAARLIDQMEAKSIVGPYEGSKPREVLITLEQFQAGRISS